MSIALFDLAHWTEPGQPRRCRDCGRTESRCPRTRCIEGIRDGHHFILCDDCAEAEGRWGL